MTDDEARVLLLIPGVREALRPAVEAIVVLSRALSDAGITPAMLTRAMETS